MNNNASNEIKIYKISNGFLVALPEARKKDQGLENLFSPSRMLDFMDEMQTRQDPVLRELKELGMGDTLPEPDEQKIETDATIIFCKDKAAVSAYLLSVLD